ncbi:MAG TPA: sulfotransferase domain-containing protein [Mycobacteriales bacterium]|nr:sulfotransferase domain-containing protein [Mycobacteriales bacterium]
MRRTSAVRLQPDFLIVGAQRSGSTTMWKTLVQHPLVAKPFLRKGVHYFDKRYDRGPQWYRGHFPVAATARLRRLGRGRPLTGESSPYYMHHPLAGPRIAADLPHVKLLVVLRDPVERAYSGHSHELARGYETEPFDRAVALEPERLAGERERMVAEPGYESHAWQHHAYLRRGQYHEQLVALERLVGRERLHVVDSQDFWTDPEPSFAGVLRFLGLPPHPRTVFERHNARSRSPLPAALRTELEEHFAPHDERLAAWLGRTPSWRR